MADSYGMLVKVRERSYAELLDLAVQVIRSRPVPLLVSALAGILPFVAFNAWVESQLGTENEDRVPGLMSLFLILLEAPWATAPLTIVLGGMMFGRTPGLGAFVKTWFRSLPSLVTYQVIIRTFLIGMGIYLILWPIRLSFVNEVILLERGSWSKVMGRSSDLSQGRAGELFAQALVQLALGIGLVIGVWVGTGVLLSGLIDDPEWKWPTEGFLVDPRTVIAVWGAVAFFTVARFLIYIDQRIRLEGWELRHRLQVLGASLEGRSS